MPNPKPVLLFWGGVSMLLRCSTLEQGHLVREIDAAGGLMAAVADCSGTMFHVLNASKGAAVQVVIPRPLSHSHPNITTLNPDRLSGPARASGPSAVPAAHAAAAGSSAAAERVPGALRIIITETRI